MNAAVLISASRARPAPPGQATRSSLPAATCRRQHPLRRGSLARAPRAAQSSDATCAPSAAPLDVLLHACRTQQVAAEEVLAALQQVEASHAGQPQVQGALVLSMIQCGRQHPSYRAWLTFTATAVAASNLVPGRRNAVQASPRRSMAGGAWSSRSLLTSLRSTSPLSRI